MNLTEQLQELKEHEVQVGALCRVKIVEKELPIDDVAAYLDAVENKDINAAKLSKTLANNGFHLSVDSIRRHRRRHSEIRGCKCP
jgi:hypothetical protein